MTPRSPVLARGLIRLLTPRGDRSFVLRDLDETFASIAETRGLAAARRWYRRQAVTSIGPLFASRMGESLRSLRTGDVRHALRLLRRRPHYAAGVAGTLALGFASAIVLGGLAWRVWLQPLPLHDSERLVRVYERGPADASGARERYPPSPPLLYELRQREWTHLTGFAAILGSTPEWIVEGEMRQLRGAAVSPGFFELLGIPPLHGRAEWRSRDGDEVPEVILSEAFWHRAFGGDPGAVGARIDLAGVEHTIVGVVRQEGGYPDAVDLFTPLVWEPHQLGDGFRGARYLEVVGRVAPASSIEAGSLEIATFVDGLGAEWPSHVGWSGEVVSLRADLVGPFRAVLRLLLVAGFAFLALAVVNVVGLAALRALEQTRETAVRVALGASHARLGRRALVEGALLGALGGAGALAMARVLMGASIRWLPEDLPRTGSVILSAGESVGWLALAVGAGAAIVALSHRLVPVGALRATGARTSRRLAGTRALVVGQFALTTLLVGVGTLVLERSFELADHELGFDAGDVWTGFVALPRSTNEDWEARRDTWGGLVRELEDRGYPTALSTNPPLSRSNSRFSFRRFPEDEQSFGQYAIVSPNYFEVMGVPIRDGRTFAPGESAPVVLISERLAEEHFPGEEPVGLTLSILQVEHEVIGVVGNTSHFGPDTPEPPMMYVSYEKENWNFAHVLVAGGEEAVGAISAALGQAVPGAAVPDVTPYERHLSQWFRPLRIQAGIVGALAAVGSLLAALGLYSAIGFQVRGRLPELGIRKALGATDSSLVAGVVRHGVVTAGFGLGLGVPVWWLASGPLGGAVGAAGEGPSLLSIGVTALLVLGLSGVAVAAPARRAASADALAPLRAE